MLPLSFNLIFLNRGCQCCVRVPKRWLLSLLLPQISVAVAMSIAMMRDCRIADVAISKRPLLFTVWTQLHLQSHQNAYKIFTRKQFLPTFAGNAQAQLHFWDDQQRAFGISNISNCVVCWVLCLICIISDTCHAEREYPQDGGHRKKADGLYSYEMLGQLKNIRYEPIDRRREVEM